MGPLKVDPRSVTFDTETDEIRSIIGTQHSAAITLQPSKMRQYCIRYVSGMKSVRFCSVTETPPKWRRTMFVVSRRDAFSVFSESLHCRADLARGKTFDTAGSLNAKCTERLMSVLCSLLWIARCIPSMHGIAQQTYIKLTSLSKKRRTTLSQSISLNKKVRSQAA